MQAWEKETRANLVKVKHQIQFTYIPEETIQHLDEEMNSFQVRQLVVVCVHAHAEEQPRVAPVYYFRGAEFNKVGLMLLVSWRNQPMDLRGR